MTFIRGIAATTMLAGLAVATAGTASADLPTMNGSYTATSTAPSGKSVDSDWTVNGCGDGCLYVKAGAGGGMAYLEGNEWVMDTSNNLVCPGGQWNQYATSAHLTWDTNSLEGTSVITYVIPACGKPAGYVQTNQLSIKQAS